MCFIYIITDRPEEGAGLGWVGSFWPAGIGVGEFLEVGVGVAKYPEVGGANGFHSTEYRFTKD